MRQLAAFRPTRSVLLRIALSLILSVLLWGWVTSLADPQETRVASNVQVANGVPADGLVVSTTRVSARVEATGPDSVLEDFGTADLALTLDLDGIDEPGTYTVPIVPVAEERFVEYEIIPATTSIVVDALVSAVFPIQVQIVGTTSPEQRIVSQQLSAPEVTITGPRSIVETVTSTQVDVDPTDQLNSFSVQSQVYAVTRDGNRIDSTTQQNVTLNPSFVEASVEVQSSGREVTVLANITGSPADGYEQRNATTTPRTVVIDGPPELLATLTFVETAPVDISGATDTVSQTVGIVGLPSGVSTVDPGNGQVSVIVQVQPQSVSQTLPSLPVDVTGLGDGLSATVAPESVSLDVSATSSQVPDLVNGAISISVDLSGLGPGTYPIAPLVNVPAGVEWDTISPALVTVVITRGSSAGGTPPPQIATPLP